MEAFKAYILDDEAAAIRSLGILLEKYCPEVLVVGQSRDPILALKELEEVEIDILFLDIQMPEMDGFQFIQQLDDHQFQIIFTTAHDEYALQAIKAEALDYLLKPIGKDDIISAVQKVAKNRAEQNDQVDQIRQLLRRIEQVNEGVRRISLPTQEGLEFIDIDSINYCSSDGSYTSLFLNDGRSLMVSKPIGFIESKLTNDHFYRIHHSYIVNVKVIKKYLKGRGGSIVLNDGTTLPVSSRKKTDFLDSF